MRLGSAGALDMYAEHSAFSGSLWGLASFSAAPTGSITRSMYCVAKAMTPGDTMFFDGFTSTEGGILWATAHCFVRSQIGGSTSRVVTMRGRQLSTRPLYVVAFVTTSSEFPPFFAKSLLKGCYLVRTMIAFAKRQRAVKEIERRRGDLKTYTEPLDRSREDLKDFLTDFYSNILFQRQVEMQQISIDYPAVQGFYRELVPNVIQHEDFWQRYYYRTDCIDRVLQELEDEDAAKLKSRSESVKLSWSSLSTSNVHGVLNQYSTNLDSLRKLESTPGAHSCTLNDNNEENVENAPSAHHRIEMPKKRRSLFSIMTEPSSGDGRDNFLVNWSRSLANLDQSNKEDEEPVEDDMSDEFAALRPEPTAVSVKPVSTVTGSLGVESEAVFVSPEKQVSFQDDIVECLSSSFSDAALDSPRDSSSAPPTSSVWTLGLLFLAFCGVCCAVFSEVQMNHPELIVAAQDGLCGPVAPWSFLSGNDFEWSAPWWAPGSRVAFETVCGSKRPFTKMTWKRSRKGTNSLTIVDQSKNNKRILSKTGVKSVVFSPHDVTWNDGRKTGAIAVPWKL